MLEPNSDFPCQLISELVADPDFPASAVGKNVDIKGFTGIIVEVVKNSIKVRPPEGNTVSYNFHVLRRIYAPRVEPEPIAAEPEPVLDPPPIAQPKRNTILEPDFKSPLVPIETLVQREDFPACTFGLHIDLHGYTGVVVELVGHSLKVRLYSTNRG